jgi:hypothetical protein
VGVKIKLEGSISNQGVGKRDLGLLTWTQHEFAQVGVDCVNCSCFNFTSEYLDLLIDFTVVFYYSAVYVEQEII